MAFEIRKGDIKKLDQLTGLILEAYKNGDIKRASAEYLIGHLIMAAAQDNEGELLAWADPDQQARWLEEAKNA